MTEDTLTARQLCAVVGITYRQLDYWARTDLLRPSVVDAAGSGSCRRYSIDDARVALGINRSLDAGLSLQRVRDAIGYLRDPEGCQLLYVGLGGVGVCNADALLDVIDECRGLLVIIDIASLSDDIERAVANLVTRSEIAPAEPTTPGPLAGTQHGSINKLDRTPAEPALTREELMRLRA